MKVHIDDQVFTAQARGGISRYFVELMNAYSGDASFGVELTEPRFWTMNEALLERGGGRRLPTRLGQVGPLLRAANRFGQRSSSAEVVHYTYYLRGYLKRFEPRQVRVATIHDMIPERFPSMFPKGSPHKAKADYIRSADLLFCVSEAAKQDLIEIYGLPSAPIIVTPLAASERFHSAPTVRAALPDDYVLYVGGRADYKDFAVLARAFREARLPREVSLVAVGGGAWSSRERELLAQLGLTERALQRTLDDQSLVDAYARARCFVFPSRYEGFGLPTLEAMATGCPTILADTSSHPEVGGDAALYFPAGDDAALARLLDEVVGSEPLREQLRLRGPARASLFSWKETARRTAEGYREALAGHTQRR